MKLIAAETVVADCSKSTNEIIINDNPVTNLEPNLSYNVSEATSIIAVTDETQVYFDTTVTNLPEAANNSLEKSNASLKEIFS